VSQLRLNPLTGRWVTVVPERAERPNDFAPRSLQVETGPARPCPFCPGNEETAPATFELSDTGGEWRQRIVPNLYPAFEGDEHLAVRNLGPVHVMAEASGTHDVFVLTRDHWGGLHRFSDAEAADTMRSLKNRFAQHAQRSNIRYTQAIVNHGREAGASLVHPHGQLLGLPFVPGEILDEERAFARFEGGCILCATVEAESVSGERIVNANDHCVSIAPFWSGSPFELLIVPRAHCVHLTEADDDSVAGVGLAIRDSLAQLNALFGDVAYNLVIHTAPHHDSAHYHWHVHVWPKLVTTAGFERGTGVMINIVPPETAADELRRVAVRA
jgi:UDPglucose--hexose-1-phosphate uridylyltransferase